MLRRGERQITRSTAASNPDPRRIGDKGIDVLIRAERVPVGGVLEHGGCVVVIANRCNQRHIRGKELEINPRRLQLVRGASVCHISHLDACADVVLGGVSYSDPIAKWVEETVNRRGLRFASHTRVPNGDGGISVGQNAIAGSLLG